VRIVAVNHDTSIVMIERTYSRHIGDHADALARAALLDTSTPMAGNVVPIRARKPAESFPAAPLSADGLPHSSGVRHPVLECCSR
jgi:hypothetical protein